MFEKITCAAQHLLQLRRTWTRLSFNKLACKGFLFITPCRKLYMPQTMPQTMHDHSTQDLDALELQQAGAC